MKAFATIFYTLFPEYGMDMYHLNKWLFCFPPGFVTTCYIAEKNGEVVGIAAGTENQRERKLYLQCITVLPSCRRQGIASHLLGFFRDRGVPLFFSGCPTSYLVPGIDRQRYPSGYAFLIHHGFQAVGKAVSMKRTLQGVALLPLEEYGDQNLKITDFSDEFLLEILSICSSCSHGEWRGLLIGGYCNRKGASHGFVARIEGKVVGFAFCGLASDDISRFGPIGVLPEFRKRKIGISLVNAILSYQRECGCLESYFLWGEPDTGALDMYGKIGFKSYSEMEILQLIG
jgi:GNAT superfamily N-acetyltransferase